jgi:hypothetical protein
MGKELFCVDDDGKGHGMRELLYGSGVHLT